MSDAETDALRRYQAATRALTQKQGKAAGGAEAEFAQAYQLLVRLGLRPQVRGKYRAP